MKIYTLLALLFFGTIIEAQSIDYLTRVYDINRDAIFTGPLVKSQETADGTYLNHRVSFNEEQGHEVSFFNGQQVNPVYKSSETIHLLAANERGVYLIDENPELWAEDHYLVFYDAEEQRLDTLSESMSLNAPTVLLADKFVALVPDQGVFAYTNGGAPETLLEEYRDCVCEEPTTIFGDELIIQGYFDVHKTDGTPQGTGTILENYARIQYNSEFVFSIKSDIIEAYHVATGELSVINADEMVVVDSIIIGDETQYVLDTTSVFWFDESTPSKSGLFFSARLANTQFELFHFAGDLPGVTSAGLTENAAEVSFDNFGEAVSDYFLFENTANDSPVELWISDGTVEGTGPAIVYQEAELDFLQELSFAGYQAEGDRLFVLTDNFNNGYDLHLVDVSTAPSSPTFISELNNQQDIRGGFVFGERLILHSPNTDANLYSYGTTAGDAVPVYESGGRTRIIYRGDNHLYLFDLNTLFIIDVESSEVQPVLQTSNDPVDRLQLVTAAGTPYLHVADSLLAETIYRLDDQDQTLSFVTDIFDRNDGSYYSAVRGYNGHIFTQGASGSRYIVSPTYLASPETSPPPTGFGNVAFGRGTNILGQIGSKFYLSVANNPVFTSEVDEETGTKRDVRDIFEIEPGTDFGHTVILGEYGYAISYNYLSSPFRLERHLTRFDFQEETMTRIYSDTIPELEVLSDLDNIATDDELLYFTVFANDSIGPATYNPTSEEITMLDRIDRNLYVEYYREEDQLLVRYHPFLEDGELYILSSTGVGPQIEASLQTDRLVATAEYIVGRNFSGDLFSVNRTTGDSTLLATHGGGPLIFSSFTDTPEGKIAFVRRVNLDEQYVWMSDGTRAGTARVAEFPDSLRSPVRQTAAFGRYLAFYTNDEELLLFDPQSASFQRVDLRLDVLPSEFNNFDNAMFMTVVNGNLYFPAWDFKHGVELRELSIAGGAELNGIVFSDHNDNGVQDDGEPGVSRIPIDVSGGTFDQLFTDEDGRFALNPVEGVTYRLSPRLSTCFSEQSGSEIEITVASDSIYNVELPLTPVAGPPALRTLLNSPTIRCGFTHDFYLTVLNDGCQPLAGETSVTFPEDMTYVESDQEPLSNEENTLTFSFDTLQPNQSQRIRIRFTMPDENFAGQDINLGAAAGAVDVEGAMIQSDTFAYSEILRCAIDPNDKQVHPNRPEPSGSNYTQLDETLRYTIRFQNTGNDTAFTVRIEDQISPNLDLATLKPLTASHPFSTTVRDDRTVVFLFENILLPDSTTNLPGSQGFVTFEINPFPDLADFTPIPNTAGIFFDFNQPVITNTVTSTLVEFLDEDQDGFLFYEECDDRNPDVNPAAPEIPNNGIDENCDDLDDFPVATNNHLPGTLQAFPNPTDGQYHLNYSETTPLAGMLIDAKGTVLQRFRLQGRHALDLSELPSGLYLLRLYDQERGGGATLRVVRR